MPTNFKRPAVDDKGDSQASAAKKPRLMESSTRDELKKRLANKLDTPKEKKVINTANLK